MKVLNSLLISVVTASFCVGAFASRTESQNTALTARIDNLMDRDYTQAKDYATAGRTFYVGLKWMPQ